MRSQRKIAANRSNGAKSKGPRSAAGKAIASRSALRHGLAAITYRATAPAGDVESLARAICGDDDHTELFAAAVAIAEHWFVRRAIKQQQIIVIERLREATAIALAKGDNSIDLAKARILQMWIAHRDIEALLPKVLARYKLPHVPRADFEDFVPIRLKARLDETECSAEERERLLEFARRQVREAERDEFEALEEAIPDLIRLDRYERRAWSQQLRAIREFLNTKMMRDIESYKT